MKLKTTIAAALAFAAVQGASALTFTFDFTNDVFTPGNDIKLFDESGKVSLTASAFASQNTFAQVIGSLGNGLGVTQENDVADGDPDQIDSMGPDETLRLDLGFNFRIVEALIKNTQDSDDGIILVDGNEVYNGELNGFGFANTPGLIIDTEGQIIDFTVQGGSGADARNNDYFVKSITIERVPDSGVTLGMLGGALVGIAALRRRFKK